MSAGQIRTWADKDHPATESGSHLNGDHFNLLGRDEISKVSPIASEIV